MTGIPLPRKGTIPSELDRAALNERLVKVHWQADAIVDHDVEVIAYDAAGCDLTVANSGHAPLLLSHDSHPSALLGVILEAWVEGAHGHAIARFARRPLADEYLGMLTDGMPLAGSLGTQLVSVEPAGELAGSPCYRAVEWLIREISLCAIGRSHSTRLCKPAGDLVASLERQRALRLARERFERLRALDADGWTSWARNGAAAQLAADLALPADRVRGPLSRLVDQRLAGLVGDG